MIRMRFLRIGKLSGALLVFAAAILIIGGSALAMNAPFRQQILSHIGSRTTSQRSLRINVPAKTDTNKASSPKLSASAASDRPPVGFDDTAQTSDKLPIPKSTRPLVFSPSSITLYKNVSGSLVKGLKANVTETVVTAKSSDGKPMYFPVTDAHSDMFLTADSFTVRPTWNLTASTNYAEIGTRNVQVSAIAADDTVSYVGTLRVTVLPLPVFSIASTGFSATTSYIAANFSFWDFSGIVYNSGFKSTDIPTMSIKNSYGLSFVNAGYDANHLYFSAATQLDPSISPQTYYVVFENSYQSISIPVLDYVLNY